MCSHRTLLPLVLKRYPHLNSATKALPAFGLVLPEQQQQWPQRKSVIDVLRSSVPRTAG